MSHSRPRSLWLTVASYPGPPLECLLYLLPMTKPDLTQARLWDREVALRTVPRG